jgi:hypothetical protein
LSWVAGSKKRVTSLSVYRDCNILRFPKKWSAKPFNSPLSNPGESMKIVLFASSLQFTINTFTTTRMWDNGRIREMEKKTKRRKQLQKEYDMRFLRKREIKWEGMKRTK